MGSFRKNGKEKQIDYSCDILEEFSINSELNNQEHHLKFIDLKEVKEPEKISFTNTKKRWEFPKGIEFLETDQDIEKTKLYTDWGRKNKKEKPVIEKEEMSPSYNTPFFEKKEDGLEGEQLIHSLIEKINWQNDHVVYPGKVELTSQEIEGKESAQKEIPEELFGVDRDEIFASIEEKTGVGEYQPGFLRVLKLRNKESGLFVPMLLSLILLVSVSILVPLLLFYFQKNSITALEENIQKDSSILKKIAQEKKEETERLKQQLEQEMLKATNEQEVHRIIFTQELEKQKEEIEKQYEIKMSELKKQNLTEESYLAQKKQAEEEKEKALEEAKRERERKLKQKAEETEEKKRKIQAIRQKLNAVEKGAEIEVETLRSEVKQTIQKTETPVITLEERRQQEQQEKELAREVNRILMDGVKEFKKQNIAEGMKKWNSVVDIYERESALVANRPDLQERMSVDLFLIDTARNFVNMANHSGSYREDFIKLMNKWKNLRTAFHRGESLLSQKKYLEATKEYEKVLKEFDEIRVSCEKVQSLEKEIQNQQAVSVYRKALEEIKKQQYDSAVRELTFLLREFPESDYVEPAVAHLADFSKFLGSYEKSLPQMEEGLMAQAEEAENKKNYVQAKDLFEKAVLSASNSVSVADGISGVVRNALRVDREEREKKLRNDFQKNYNRFKQSEKEGDFISARNYYFQALQNAFSFYTEDSISEFIRLENRYIQSLLKNVHEDSLKSSQTAMEKWKQEQKEMGRESSEGKEKELEEKYRTLLAETGKKLELQYQKALADKEEELRQAFDFEKKRLMEEKDELAADFEKRWGSAGPDASANIVKQKMEYQKELEKKEKEIQELRNKAEENRKNGERIVELNERLLEKEKALSILEEEHRRLSEKNKEDLLELEKLNRQHQTGQEELKRQKEALLAARTDLQKQQERASERYLREIAVLKTDNTTLSSRLKELEKRYGALEKEYAESKIADERARKKTADELQNQYRGRLEEEKKRLQYEFQVELDKIGKEARSKENVSKEKERKQIRVAELIEVLGSSLTFRFLNDVISPQISTYDEVSVVRVLGSREVEVGKILVTSVSSFSVFGRGKILSITPGMSIRAGDFLVVKGEEEK